MVSKTTGDLKEIYQALDENIETVVDMILARDEILHEQDNIIREIVAQLNKDGKGIEYKPSISIRDVMRRRNYDKRNKKSSKRKKTNHKNSRKKRTNNVRRGRSRHSNRSGKFSESSEEESGYSSEYSYSEAPPDEEKRHILEQLQKKRQRR